MRSSCMQPCICAFHDPFPPKIALYLAPIVILFDPIYGTRPGAVRKFLGCSSLFALTLIGPFFHLAHIFNLPHL